MEDEFLNNDSIVSCSSIGEEVGLFGANDRGEEGLDSIDNDLGD